MIISHLQIILQVVFLLIAILRLFCVQYPWIKEIWNSTY
jgi:hypothetical protein